MMNSSLRLMSSPDVRPDEERTIQPKRVYFLSVEGRHTERDYFRHLQRFLLESEANIPWEIAILRPQNAGDSSPGQVLDILATCKDIREDKVELRDLVQGLPEKYTEDKVTELLLSPAKFSKSELKEFKSDLLKLNVAYDALSYLKKAGSGVEEGDVFGVVIDRDKDSHSLDALNSVKEACDKRQFRFCISNPCFELWLLLHLEDVKSYSERKLAKCLENKKISKQHSYVSSLVHKIAHHSKRINHECFVRFYSGNILVAADRAKDVCSKWPDLVDHLGSNLDGLVRELLP